MYIYICIYIYASLIHGYVDPKEFQSPIPMVTSTKPQVKTLAPDSPHRSPWILIGCPQNTLLVCIIIDLQDLSFFSTGNCRSFLRILRPYGGISYIMGIWSSWMALGFLGALGSWSNIVQTHRVFLGSWGGSCTWSTRGHGQPWGTLKVLMVN